MVHLDCPFPAFEVAPCRPRTKTFPADPWYFSFNTNPDLVCAEQASTVEQKTRRRASGEQRSSLSRFHGALPFESLLV